MAKCINVNQLIFTLEKMQKSFQKCGNREKDLNILLNQMKRSPVKEIYAVNNEIFINFKNFNYQRNKILRSQKNIYQYDYRNNIFSITVWNANLAVEIVENFKKLVKISY